MKVQKSMLENESNNKVIYCEARYCHKDFIEMKENNTSAYLFHYLENLERMETF